jgi:uncharacterized protein GlcG (DUF336 family)
VIDPAYGEYRPGDKLVCLYVINFNKEQPMSPVSSRLQTVVLAFVVVVGAGATGAQAQGLVTMQKLSATLANELVGEAVASCAQKGYKVVAVVVDLDGVRQALLRGDGAPIHSLDNAYYKAYSAASLTLGRKEGSTKEVRDRIAKNPPSTVPQTPLPMSLMQSVG